MMHTVLVRWCECIPVRAARVWPRLCGILKESIAAGANAYT
jgi:hypothetical protein